MVSGKPLRRVRVRPGEAGTSLIVGILSLVFIIPMVGLCIDVSVLYNVRARLQGSVDGAALAAARSLNVGQTTTAQAANAQQNAVNWFYANFPDGSWQSTATQMGLGDVLVYDEPSNPHVRTVTVSASTNAPTYFMRWLGTSTVKVSSIGTATRRDVAVMLVLDRSGSMATSNSCDPMKTAAKLFTGQFAAGRDMVGLVTFNGATTVVSSPTANFQTVLGYSNALGSSTGAIDAIQCAGGTGTAEAVAVAYNELYKLQQVGALNVLLIETDGLPNTITMNFWDAVNHRTLLSSSSSCRDNSGKTPGQGGFGSQGAVNWTPGQALGPNGFLADVPAGAVAGTYSSDPSTGQWFLMVDRYWGNDDLIGDPPALGCYFADYDPGSTSDFAYWPAKDVFGNDLNPVLNPYKPVTMSNGYVAINGWQNHHNAALNAADNSAYRARNNAQMAATVYAIGLGGDGGDPPDLTLLQRMANDPNPDRYSGTNAYPACSANPNCVYYPSQPQGSLIYSTSSSKLATAFLTISSQILRLSK